MSHPNETKVTITLPSLRLLGLLGVLGVTSYFTVPYLLDHVGLPWENECQRLDRRCERAMQSGSNLEGAVVCSLGGVVTYGNRTDTKCRKLNNMLDEQ